MRLERQLAACILQRRSEQRGEDKRRGEQPFHRRRIGVGGEHIVQHRTKAQDAAARVARRDGEAQGLVDIGWIQDKLRSSRSKGREYKRRPNANARPVRC